MMHILSEVKPIIIGADITFDSLACYASIGGNAEVSIRDSALDCSLDAIGAERITSASHTAMRVSKLLTL
jgi:hypothetical protein